MIDIHCHLLYGVDDGSDSIEESVMMLKSAKAQGVDHIILTPHLRHGMFEHNLPLIEKNFKSLLPYADKIGIGISLGTEYHVNSDMVSSFKSGRCHTLADTSYILTEFKTSPEFSLMVKTVQDSILAGFIPVIAHVERCACLVENPQLVAELQARGAWIQVNADAVLGLDGHGPKKFCKKLLKSEWVDIIASDSHGIKNRACHMQDCYKYITKKYDQEYANILMQDNPAVILRGE